MRVIEGNPGTVNGEKSRSLEQLVAKGKAAIIPAPALETIIGQVDSRVRILDTDLDPWRMICNLEITGPLGRFVGTGWFAGPRTVITAGHCVSAPMMGGNATSIRVTPGRNVGAIQYGSKVSTSFSATNLWYQNQDPDFDIGCIHLAEPFDPIPGWFTIESMDPAELEGYLINVAGYPGDKGGDKMYHHANQVLTTSDRRLFYNVDTMGGQSGGPAWVHKSENGPPVVVGIHAYGEGATPANFNIEANSAPRIIPEVFDLIQGWVTADS